MTTATFTDLHSSACVIFPNRSLGETPLAKLRQEHGVPPKDTAGWSQSRLAALKPEAAAELDGFRNGWVYLLLQEKFANIRFTFTVNGKNVTVDNYPTVAKEAPTLAELLVYPLEAFDGRMNLAEQRRIRSERRKSRRQSRDSRKGDRYSF